MTYIPTDEHPLPTSTGDVVGPALSVASEAALFDGTSGKLLKRATGTGIVHRTSGVDAVSAVNLASADVTGDLPYSNLAQAAALSVLGVTGNATADVAAIAAGSDKQVLRRSGTAVAFGAVDLASSAAVTGVLPIANFTTGTPDGTKFVRDDGVLAVPSGSGNAFGTVAVSGQSDVVADQANDTLTFVAGSNVTLTTSAGGDSVTIAASGGGGSGGLIGIQVITATGAGTYTPTSGTASVVLELQGGGGGGGAVAQPGGASIQLGRGGGGGGWLRIRLTANFSSAGYVVGAKGTGGSAGANPGTAGAATTFTTTAGSPVTYTAGGGGGGSAGATQTAPTVLPLGTGTGGTCTNGDLQRPGGAAGTAVAATQFRGISGGGGSAYYAAGAPGVDMPALNTGTAGTTATGKGGGGSGAAINGTGTAAAGGDGADGVLFIWEYN